MITVDIQHNEIDPSLWNELISHSISDIHSIYQTYEWAQLMKAIYSQFPVFLLVYKNSKLIGGQLFFIKKVFLFFRSFESQGGPLVIDNSNFGIVETAVLEYYQKNWNFNLYVLTRPKITSDSISKYFEKGFRNTHFYTFLLNLDKNENVLWDSFHKHIRNSVRKAEKNGLKFVEAVTWNDWFKFYKLHVDHSNRRGIATKSEGFFKILFEEFLPKDMTRLFIALDGDQLVGGMIFLQYQNTMTYYIGASDDEYAKCSPNDLLMWNSIKWGAGNNIHILDLGDTSPDPKSHVYSIHKFKKKWGGELISRDFYIRGILYRLGRHFVANNRILKSLYETLHEYNVI